MRETTVRNLIRNIEGYSKNPEWEVLSISQQQGQPDTWLVVVKDHRTEEARAVFADQVYDHAEAEEANCKNCGDKACDSQGNDGEACGCYKTQQGGKE